MEDKKLNFNQPFLSVRRNSPNVTSQRSKETKTESNNSHSAVVVIPHQLPSHRSELKSGPIRNPGAVPFLWEQKPGQPKHDTIPKTPNSSHHKPPVAPKLPPGRYPNPNPNSNPNQQHDRCCNNYKDNNRQDVSLETSSPCVENLEREEEKESNSDSEDSDGAYVDALETLSRTESYFLNCSMSGLSGLDDFDIIKPSERFSTDPKAREFMMDRFLPAAKAMTSSETPQYASKAQNISQQQQQQQLKKTVNDQYNKPSLRYGPSFAKRYSHYNIDIEKEEEESDDDDDDYDQHANSLGVCGLIPRFCLKGSFGLLNQPISSCNNKVQRPRSSSSAGSYSQTEIKSGCNYRTELKSVDKIREAALNHEEEKTQLRNDDTGELEAEGAGLHGKCGVTTFEELLADQGSPPPKESNSGCPVIEKTVHVDTTMQIVASPNFTRNYCQPPPIAPPLPKSPSDSWLWRTLPSMSAKNSSLSLYIGAATKQVSDEDRSTTASNMKWETIVKTTKMPRHDHLHYSRESLTAIPET